MYSQIRTAIVQPSESFIHAFALYNTCISISLHHVKTLLNLYKFVIITNIIDFSILAG